jgi:hypothetical protein
VNGTLSGRTTIVSSVEDELREIGRDCVLHDELAARASRSEVSRTPDFTDFLAFTSEGQNGNWISAQSDAGIEIECLSNGIPDGSVGMNQVHIHRLVFKIRLSLEPFLTNPSRASDVVNISFTGTLHDVSSPISDRTVLSALNCDIVAPYSHCPSFDAERRAVIRNLDGPFTISPNSHEWKRSSFPPRYSSECE